MISVVSKRREEKGIMKPKAKPKCTLIIMKPLVYRVGGRGACTGGSELKTIQNIAKLYIYICS